MTENMAENGNNFDIFDDSDLRGENLKKFISEFADIFTENFFMLNANAPVPDDAKGFVMEWIADKFSNEKFCRTLESFYPKMNSKDFFENFKKSPLMGVPVIIGDFNCSTETFKKVFSSIFDGMLLLEVHEVTDSLIKAGRMAKNNPKKFMTENLILSLIKQYPYTFIDVSKFFEDLYKSCNIGDAPSFLEDAGGGGPADSGDNGRGMV